MELVNEGIPEEFLREFKKVGSNFQIKDRTVLFEPRGAWRILAESGFCGGKAEQTALRADHIFGSETLFEKLRRGGDSNSRCLSAWRFSKPLVSTTHAPLQSQNSSIFCHFSQKIVLYLVLHFEARGLPCEASAKQGPYRLMVRTPAFQAENPGSIPGRVKNPQRHYIFYAYV